MNKPEIPITKGASGDAVPGGPAGAQPGGVDRKPDPEWHSLAQQWYAALGRSGQSEFYEDSDWAEARVWAYLLSEQLEASKPSAMMIAAWSAAASRLLVTEGDRRRVRIELERVKAADPDEDAAVAVLEVWRDRLGTGS